MPSIIVKDVEIEVPDGFTPMMDIACDGSVLVTFEEDQSREVTYEPLTDLFNSTFTVPNSLCDAVVSGTSLGEPEGRTMLADPSEWFVSWFAELAAQHVRAAYYRMPPLTRRMKIRETRDLVRAVTGGHIEGFTFELTIGPDDIAAAEEPPNE